MAAVSLLWLQAVAAVAVSKKRRVINSFMVCFLASPSPSKREESQVNVISLSFTIACIRAEKGAEIGFEIEVKA